jgi:hypothetical protein
LSKAGISKSSQKIITGTLPNQLHITKASGMGDHVIWEFYRGDGIEDVGQYDLEIIFRIKHNSNEGITSGDVKGKDIDSGDNEIMQEELRYCIDWNIEINGKEIYDHNYDKHTKNIEFGKITVNGLTIFDPHHRFKTPNKSFADGLNLMLKQGLKPEEKKEIEKKLKGFFKKQRKIKNENVKFLRPLVLVDTPSMSEPYSFQQKNI